ncbi:prenyltransferase [bacterium]|nr:prenyltransferase [bacterium]
MKDYLKLIRVKHWVKNLLIFIPIICAGLISKDNVISCIKAFFAFSFACSFVYIVNDLRDIEKDKLHPRKKNRPLPSGKIKKSTAIVIAIVMIILSIIINYFINNTFLNNSLYFLLGYVLINMAYSMGLKNVAIVDIVILASGFVLRVYYGASIIAVDVSSWLFLTIMSASLFLGLGKRKKELIHNKDSRKVLKEYNEAFLDKFQYLSLALTIVFYSLWTIEESIKYLYLTIPLLIIIFMKYTLNIEKNDEGDPTTILYQDKSLLVLCLIYGITMLLFLV